MAVLIEEETKFREENPHLYSIEDLDPENQQQPEYQHLDPSAPLGQGENQGGFETQANARTAIPQKCDRQEGLSVVSGRGNLGQERGGLRRGGGKINVEGRRQNRTEVVTSADFERHLRNSDHGTMKPGDTNSKQAPGSKSTVARDVWREQFDCPGHQLFEHQKRF